VTHRIDRGVSPGGAEAEGAADADADPDADADATEALDAALVRSVVFKFS